MDHKNLPGMLFSEVPGRVIKLQTCSHLMVSSPHGLTVGLKIELCLQEAGKVFIFKKMRMAEKWRGLMQKISLMACGQARRTDAFMGRASLSLPFPPPSPV